MGVGCKRRDLCSSCRWFDENDENGCAIHSDCECSDYERHNPDYVQQDAILEDGILKIWNKKIEEFYLTHDGIYLQLKDGKDEVKINGKVKINK